MNAASWSEWVVAGLLIGSGGIVLVAALGLVRLGDFFTRMHAAALVSTLAAWTVSLASIIHFTAGTGGMPALHTGLVVIVLSITAPVTTIVLARAALFRQRRAGENLPPPLHRRR
jgi:multicomponent K+:H+ antiporter subunit G